MPDANNELMDTLAKLFENTIAEVVSTISGISVFKDDDDLLNVNDNFAGTLPFYGEINGFFILNTDEQSLRALTSNITGCVIPSVEESDMTDCIGELANMICGTVRAKAALNGILFKLAIPFSVKGVNGLELFFKKNAKTFTLHFSSCDIHISARVVLA